MSTTREEAAPTFPAWKARLEGAEGAQLERETARFLQILKTLGTPMIEEPQVNFIYYSPQARRPPAAPDMKIASMGGAAST
jgi:hypothetical protein